MASDSTLDFGTLVSLMAYKGACFKIPLGLLGLSTDDSQDRMPVSNLLEARNLDFYNGQCASEGGSRRWNVTPLSSGVVAMHDFWPQDSVQRITVLGRDAVVRKFIDSKQNATIGPSSSSDVQTLSIASSTQPMFVQGGAEDGGPRKLFLFTGASVVQVMSGDFTARVNIALPALDWSGSNQPTAGLIHANSLFAWGNPNFPHLLYKSNALNHEDFQTNGAFQTFPCFPGEGERILGAHNYKGRMFIFKYPRGVYYLDDSDPSSANWVVRKFSEVFGAASAFGAIEALDDFFVANSQGSVTSLAATQKFGSLTEGNLLRSLRNEGYMRRIVAKFAYPRRYALWYEEKKTAYFAYQSSGGVKNDLLLKIDFNDSQSAPKISWTDKDQPNCLALVKDSINILRPYYGADDGYIYRLDSDTFDVGGSAYVSSFKTINQDFGSQGVTPMNPENPELAEMEKIYDFLEVTYEAAGNWNLTIEVYIDNVKTETLSVNMSKAGSLGTLGRLFLGPTGKGKVLGRSPQSRRVPLHGRGRRIAFKCYNSGLRQTFKISELAVYYRPAGQDQEA